MGRDSPGSAIALLPRKCTQEIVLAIFWEYRKGEKVIAPLRRFGKAHGEHIGV
jgi:hypothetical protein